MAVAPEHSREAAVHLCEVLVELRGQLRVVLVTEEQRPQTAVELVCPHGVEVVVWLVEIPAVASVVGQQLAHVLHEQAVVDLVALRLEERHGVDVEETPVLLYRRPVGIALYHGVERVAGGLWQRVPEHVAADKHRYAERAELHQVLAGAALAAVLHVLLALRVYQQRELPAVVVGQAYAVDGQRGVFAQQRRGEEERAAHALERGPAHSAAVLRVAHVAQPLEVHRVVERAYVAESALQKVLVGLYPVLPRHARERAEFVVGVLHLKHPSGCFRRHGGSESQQEGKP